MKEMPISVTLAARRFSDCINRVRYHGASFLLEKNGVPVARIVPVQPNFGSEFEQLASTLRQTRQGSPEEPELKEPTPTPTVTSDEPRQTQEQEKQPKRPTLNW
jgi:antitoxin (DNA-binding transcriptional repressor) of toxin-antitoxin stability system